MSTAFFKEGEASPRKGRQKAIVRFKEWRASTKKSNEHDECEWNTYTHFM